VGEGGRLALGPEYRDCHGRGKGKRISRPEDVRVAAGGGKVQKKRENDCETALPVWSPGATPAKRAPRHLAPPPRKNVHWGKAPGRSR